MSTATEVEVLEQTPTGVPTGRVGMWWFLASEVAIFGGLITIYSLLRFRHPEWAADSAHTINAAGATNTMVLLTSSLTAVLAHQAVKEGMLSRAVKLIAATVGFGLVFMAIKVFEYTSEVQHGFTPVAGLFWSFYYLMTGLHALHVLGGMIAFIVVAMGVARGRNTQRVEYAGMYWHLVDIIWIFLFPLLYLSGGPS